MIRDPLREGTRSMLERIYGPLPGSKTPHERILDGLAVEYYARCDAHDARIYKRTKDLDSLSEEVQTTIYWHSRFVQGELAARCRDSIGLHKALLQHLRDGGRQ